MVDYNAVKYGGCFVVRKAGVYMAFRLLSALAGPPQADMAAASKRMLAVCGLAVIAAFCVGAKSAFANDVAVRQPQSLNYAGVHELRQLEPSLTGADVNIALVCRSITYLQGQPQNDYRPNTRHNCLRHVRFSFHDWAKTLQPASAHSTAIASILFGRDPNAFHPDLGRFYYQGIVPDARATVFEFWHFIADNVFSNAAPETDVLTMSIGSQFEDWWTRGIDSMAQRHGLIVVAGIGNGSAVYDPVLYPAAGANAIGVGVIDSVNSQDLAVKLANFALANPEHSSYGPTGDGRCKPDIVAAGNCLIGDIENLSGYEPVGDFSSFSAPIVAGAAAVLVQKAKQEPGLSPAIPRGEGGNCVIKAILLNSARKLPFWHKGAATTEDDHKVPLDYVQGAGALDAMGAYRQLTAGADGPGNVSLRGWDRNRLTALGLDAPPLGVLRRYQILDTHENRESRIDNRESTITATLVWNKHFAPDYPFQPLPEKDADLRLELWAVDPNQPQKDYLLDYSDSPVDNVEHIYCRADPNYTDYEIVVSFSNPGDPNNIERAQDYAVAWNLSQAPEKNSIFWYDLNADGIVDELDLAILLKNFSDTGAGDSNSLVGDINMDGRVDIKDLQILALKTALEAESTEAISTK